MNDKNFTYLAEDFKRGIDNEISYIYSCFVPADSKNVSAVMKGNITIPDREFLDEDTRVSVAGGWTCPYDLLISRIERCIEDFYDQFRLSSNSILKLSRYGERAEVFKNQFGENLEKSKETTRKQLLREMELIVMQGKDVKTVLRHMNTAVEKRTDALNSLLRSFAGQMEQYMLLWDYQDSGYTHYRFVTVGDNCEHCRSLNGTVFDISDANAGKTLPPLHPNCDCKIHILDNEGNRVIKVDKSEIKNDNSLDYLTASLKQIFLGNYTDDTTLLGTLGQLALGFIGLDLPADIRDLIYDITNWKLTPAHALQTLLDAVSLLPLVGSIKYTDEAADVLNGVVKYGDDVVVLNKNLKPENLLKELANSGVKHNLKDVVAITKTADNKLVWLEKGNNRAGLEHIITEHGKEFNTAGITEHELPEYIIQAISRGRICGYQGKGMSARAIYEFIYKGKVQRVAIQIGDNGFIVGANPKSIKGVE